jgi:hypothetical protein
MLPAKVKIGAITYKVKEVNNMHEEFDHLGQILYTKGKIQVDKDLADDWKEQVLVHEILHGVFFEAGIEEQDEDMINRVSIILHQVLKDNDLSFSKSEKVRNKAVRERMDYVVNAALKQASEELMERMKAVKPII